MIPYILIIVFSSFSTGGIVTTQDFNTQYACENVMKKIISLELMHFKTALCMPKE